MVLKLGDVFSSSGPKVMMVLKLRVLGLGDYLVGVAIGGRVLEVGSDCIWCAGGMSRILLVCLHFVNVILRIF